MNEMTNISISRPSKILTCGLTLGACFLGMTLSTAFSQQVANITVQADQPGIAISPTLYGIFYEEINRAGDGGLYAELIRNANFRTSEMPEGFKVEGKDLITRAGMHRIVQEECKPLDGWSASGQAQMSLVHTPDECGEQGYAARVVAKVAGDGAINSGFYGIPLQAGKSYRLLFICRNERGESGQAKVELISRDGASLGQASLALAGSQWARLNAVIKATGTVSDARLRITFARPTTVLMRYVSLLPEDGWKGLPFRADLVERIRELHPAFMRFPGGSYVHNLSLDTGWNWKETVVPVERRKGRIDMWGYRATDGIGYHEYLLLCEALKMEAMPVVNVGLSCQAFKYEMEPMDKMGRWIQDALDAVEYANGPADSPWGKVRAKNGHPAPFNIKYLAIGNECGGPPYEERYPLVQAAVTKKYPDLKLIACHNMKNAKFDIYDQHFYQRPEWFIRNSAFYDKSPRDPKICVGEFASHNKETHGNLSGAIGEAVFMMGMERNSDLVKMCAYAPLFENVNMRRWPINLIVFDNTRSYGIPSYYAFKMFSETRGDRVLPCSVVAPQAEIRSTVAGGVGVGTWTTKAEFKDVEVKSGAQPLCVVANAADWATWRKPAAQWEVTKEGALLQKGEKPLTCASTGQDDWNNYTYTVKVRKNSGTEGALLYFGYKNAGNNFLWNLGAHGNRQLVLERRIDGQREEISPKVEFALEAGRWYAAKIDLTEGHLRCYLDGKLIHDIPMDQVVKSEKQDQVFASASRTDSGIIFIRAVNTCAAQVKVHVNVAGRAGAVPKIVGVTLNDADLLAENTLEKPERVVPKSCSVRPVVTGFEVDLPPYSINTFTVGDDRKAAGTGSLPVVTNSGGIGQAR